MAIDTLGSGHATIRDLVVPTLERLVRHSEITGKDERVLWALFELLTRESLSFRPDGTQPPFSGICNDGTPWQFCSTLDSSSSSLRYLTEVGSPGASLADRIALSRERIAAAFRMLDFPSVAYQRSESLFNLLPSREDLRAGLWVAVAHASGGHCRVRVYANNGWGEELERWLRLVRCLDALGGTGYAASLRRLLPILTAAFSPAGFAVTFPQEPAICKLYLRPIGNSWSACREVFRLTHAPREVDFIAGLEKSLGCTLEVIPHRALILSLAAPLTGGDFDVKVDLCGHCIFASDVEAQETVFRFADAFALDRAPYRALLDAMGSSGWQSAPELHSFLGVGMAADGKVRVNVYAKPIPAEGPMRLLQAFPRSEPDESVRTALDRGVAALLRAADSNGWWTDYSLPVGVSTTWVTAYVANSLLDACDYFKEKVAIPTACLLAAKNIQDAFRPGEGWGYHEGIETDADTTALCTLLVRRMGFDAGPGCAALLTMVREDGGLGTFRRADLKDDDAWGHTHADVFPTVLCALGDPRNISGADMVLGMREGGGFWCSYWWETNLYATEACLRFFQECGRVNECEVSRDWLLHQVALSNPFEQALCARALTTLRPDALVDGRRERLVRSLLESQLKDGSWAGCAALRVTFPDCPRPWESPTTSGPLYLDRGILTTATVVSALSQILGCAGTCDSFVPFRHTEDSLP